MTSEMFSPQVSIGVLAHNEESRIGKTLRSLFEQDVFELYVTEVVVVANGCTDETIAAAERSLADHYAAWSARGAARVENLTVAGKANAWNQFVHAFSSSRAEMLVLMDADISLLSCNTISSMIATLKKSSQAVVCVDRPVKDIEIKLNRNIFERLLVSATPVIDPDDVPLCGQLYCAHSIPLRQFRLPIEIMCEDGFVRALLLTQGFTEKENRKRIVLDPSVSHSFASVSSLRELFSHEKWLTAGCIIDMLLFERFSKECGPNRSATDLMLKWQEKDRDWLPRYVESQIQARGWRLLPRHWWTRRWSRFREFPLAKKFRRIPVTLLAAVMDAVIFIAAIRDVHRGRAFRYWGRK